MTKSILYIQYTNPAGYPPLEHSSRMLADRGWTVHFFGADVRGVETLAFPHHPSIGVETMPVGGYGGSEQRRYAAFVARALAIAARVRPQWIYASEPLSCPVALTARTLLRRPVIYHEHDSPSGPGRSRRDRIVMAARRTLARSADICILPQQQRMERFLATTGRKGLSFVVPNVPERREIARARTTSSGPLTFYYHGTLNHLRLPFAVLEGLAAGSPTARLTFAGYETAGSVGFVQEFLSRAAALGIAGRVRHLGPLPSRTDLLHSADGADVGLALMPPASDDINLVHMVGASNKPFDYLARGLALCVSDLPDWKAMFVDPGMALSVDPTSASGFRDRVSWCEANRDAVRAMGERGRLRIEQDWNYERQFASVLERIEGRSLAPSRVAQETAR